MNLTNQRDQSLTQKLFSLVVRRAGAFFVDIFILFGVLGPTGFLIQRLFGHQPQTGPDIWYTLLLNFSFPTWLYFTLSDRSSRGATLGKRLFRLRVIGVAGTRLGFWQALGRTAIKLLPWELIHVSAFALSTDMSRLSPQQTVGLAVASGLAFLYFVVAVITRGQRSAHDFAMRTEVQISEREK